MAKKITEEDIRLNLIVNGDDGRAAIIKQEDEVDKLSASFDKAQKELEEMTKPSPMSSPPSGNNEERKVTEPNFLETEDGDCHGG